MFKTLRALALGVLLICASAAPAQSLRSGDELFSPSAALVFYETAHELINSGSENTDVSAQNAEQALIFLTAAAVLDNQTDYVLPDILKVACRTESPLSLGMAYSYGRSIDVNDPNKTIGPKDNSELVRGLLGQYVNRSADLQIAREAVAYLIGRLDSREQREQMLGSLLQQMRGRNDLFVSELATSFGLLAAEKADFEVAQSSFITALGNNKYNRLAFDKLYELAPDNINAAIFLEHLRYRLGENPLDLQAALVFANATGQHELFQTAVDAYAYCSNLFEYLYPGEPLPQYIYLPWALNAYSSPRKPHVAGQVAAKVRQQGTFDVVLETVAAKAEEEIGNPQSAADIFNAAEQTILAKYEATDENRSAIAEQIAWFYSFGKVEPPEAIDWANKAYAAEPNNPTAAALLAYALVLNEQPEWAKPFFESYKPNIIMNLTKAQVELTDSNNTSSIEALQEIIASAPESLEAKRARELLENANSVYVPKADPDLIQTVLEASFGTSVVPMFLRPDEIFDAQLNLRGDKFAYGSDFRASLIITNRSTEPMVISEYGLLSGNIRIDAKVTGDLNKTIPNLVSKKIQPSEQITPNSTLIVPVKLMTGQLRKILKRYPQASLEIEFTVYLDPVTLEDGSIANRLEDVQPIVVKAARPGINLTARFLRNRMSSLKRRRQSRNTAQLFAGLLIEQHMMAGREPLYPVMYAEWMPDMLKSGLAYNLTSDDWSARIYTMQAMFDLPLEFELIEAASENLNNENWPVRMMALYLLAKNQNDAFGRVLDHTAKYDPNKLVRDMAVALGAKQPDNQ